MAKPTTLPRWAETTGGVQDPDITEPSSGKKDGGWDVAEKPAAQYWNWLLNLIYRWIAWLDTQTFVGDANTPNGVGFKATGRAAHGAHGAEVAATVPRGWIADTAQVAGDRVVGANGTNVYQCVTPGTTSGAGTGPSGTGSGIADGTCTWDFVIAVNDLAAVKGTGGTSASGGPARGTPGAIFTGGAGTGGVASGVGARVTAGGAGAVALEAVSTTGTAVFGASTTGDAIYGSSSSSGTGVGGDSVSGYGGEFAGNATRAALRLVPQAAPSSGQTGDVYYDSGTNKLRVCTVTGTPGTWVDLH